MPNDFPRFARGSKVVDWAGKEFPPSMVLVVDDVCVYHETYSYLVFPERGTSHGHDLLQENLSPAHLLQEELSPAHDQASWEKEDI